MKAINFLFIIALVFFLPLLASAEKVTLGNITVEEQQQPDGTFQIYIEFALPALPDKVNIDFALLRLGLDFATAIKQEDVASGGNMVELFGAARDRKEADAELAYNSFPVTGRLPKGKTGAVAVAFDITQLLDLWVNRNVENNGVLIVSHRRAEKKALQRSHVALDAMFKAEVILYYTPDK